MGTGLTGRVEVVVQANTVRADPLSNPIDQLSAQVRRSFTFGTAANQVNKCWHNRGTLTQNTAEDIDLSGTLEDELGEAVVFTLIKAIFIRNNSTASTLKIGGDAASVPIFGAVADFIVLRPGGSILLECIVDATGYVVTAATGDILQVQHGGQDAAALTYDIVVLGA